MASSALDRPRKTPKQARSRVTVESILEATAHILIDEGYDRASTNRIAKRAGVSVGSLYQYFPSKDAILVQIAERYMSEVMAILGKNLVLMGEEPEQAVREIIAALLQAKRVKPRLQRVLLEHAGRLGLDRSQLELGAQASALLRGHLERHRDGLRVRDLDLATFVVVHAVMGLLQSAVLSRPDLVADDRFVDETADLILRYLVEAPDSTGQGGQP